MDLDINLVAKLAVTSADVSVSSRISSCSRACMRLNLLDPSHRCQMLIDPSHVQMSAPRTCRMAYVRTTCRMAYMRVSHLHVHPEWPICAHII